MRASTVPAGFTNSLVLYAEDKIDRSVLLAVPGLDEQALGRSDGRIARNANAALWSKVARITGEPALGLAVAGSETNVNAFGLVGFLAMTSATVGEAIEQTVSYQRLIQADMDLRLFQVDHEVQIEKTLRNSVHDENLIVDYCLASLVVLPRRWSGTSLVPKRVCFRHSPPADASAYDRLFRCPVQFDQPSNVLVFDREVLTSPLRTAQPLLSDYLAGQARVALADVPSDVVSAVRAVVQEGLVIGEVQLSRVARRLGMSSRTLQRRLAEQGLLYEALVDEVRRSQAIPLVVHSSLPLEEVSAQLGYSEPKAFRRAFRRWTGMAPAQARGRRDARFG